MAAIDEIAFVATDIAERSKTRFQLGERFAAAADRFALKMIDDLMPAHLDVAHVAREHAKHRARLVYDDGSDSLRMSEAAFFILSSKLL